MTASPEGPPGLILFAHGARDPQWSEPFLRLRDRLRDVAPAARVELAFLEHMSPDVATAAARLADSGCTRIRIVPVFLGRGGHLQKDLPSLIDAIRAAYPLIDVRPSAPAGESDVVIAAIAAYCAAQL